MSKYITVFSRSMIESVKVEASNAISDYLLPIPLKLKHVAKICGNSRMIDSRDCDANTRYFLSSAEAVSI